MIRSHSSTQRGMFQGVSPLGVRQRSGKVVKRGESGLEKGRSKRICFAEFLRNQLGKPIPTIRTDVLPPADCEVA
jgi:hypothetical protein